MKIQVILMLILIGCMSNHIEKPVANAIKTYTEDNEISDGAHINVQEYLYDDLQIFRIMSSITYDKENMPSKIFKQGDYYVLLHSKNQPKLDPHKLPKAIIDRNNLYKNSGLIEFYTPVEWIVIICPRNEKYQIVKDTGFAPLDSLKQVQEFKCE
ncbi:MAG: hypothetical protein WD604_05380 [Balneolaceae bacterium]